MKPNQLNTTAIKLMLVLTSLAAPIPGLAYDDIDHHSIRIETNMDEDSNLIPAIKCDGDASATPLWEWGRGNAYSLYVVDFIDSRIKTSGYCIVGGLYENAGADTFIGDNITPNMTIKYEIKLDPSDPHGGQFTSFTASAPSVTYTYTRGGQKRHDTIIYKSSYKPFDVTTPLLRFTDKADNQLK